MSEQPARSDVSYEQRDVRMAPMIFMGIAIILLGLVAHGVCLWLFDTLAARANKQDQGRSPVGRERLNLWKEQDRIKIPSPRLQVNEELDMEQFRQVEEARLNSYGWTDKEKGTVHIPIAQAIELLADPEYAKTKGIAVAPKDGAAPAGGKR
jgi:hypothetical protein